MWHILSRPVSWPRAWWFILLLILTASLFRFPHIQDHMWWGDSSRDVMVAKRIIDTDRFTLVAPHAAGAAGVLANSPLYFYQGAVLWFFTHSATAMAGIVALSGVLAVVFTFLTTRRVFGTFGAGITALGMALNSFLIMYTRSVFQPMFLPFWCSLGLYAVVRGWQENRLSWYLLSSFAWFMALHSHYSVLLVFPLALSWIILGIVVWYRAFRQFWIAAYAFLFVVLQFLLWYGITNVKSWLDIANFATKASTATGFHVRFHTMFVFLFGNSGFTGVFVGMVVFLFSFIVLLRLIQTSSGKERVTLAFLTVIGVSILGTSMYNGKLLDSYFMPYYLLWFIFLGALMQVLWKKTPAVALLFALSILWFNQQDTWLEIAPRSSSEFERAQHVSLSIQKHVETWWPVPSEVIAPIYIEEVHEPGSILGGIWNTPGYWYFLEKAWGISLLRLRYGHNNLETIEQFPEYAYVICLDVTDENRDKRIQECFNGYSKAYPYFVEPTYTLIEHDPQKNEVIAVFTVLSGAQRPEVILTKKSDTLPLTE